MLVGYLLGSCYLAGTLEGDPAVENIGTPTNAAGGGMHAQPMVPHDTPGLWLVLAASCWSLPRNCCRSRVVG